MLTVVGKNPTFSWLFRHPSMPLPLPGTGLLSPECSQGKNSKGWWFAGEPGQGGAPGALATPARVVKVHPVISGEVSPKDPWPVTNYSIWIYWFFLQLRERVQVGSGVWLFTTNCQKSRAVFLLFSPRSQDSSLGPRELPAGMRYAVHRVITSIVFQTSNPCSRYSSKAISPKALHKMVLLLMIARVCHPPKRHSD